MSRAWLSLGANIGDRWRQLEEALRRLNGHPAIRLRTLSAIIETEPWGKTDQPRFLNLAVEIETTLLPTALLKACLDVERAMGRERKERWGPRTIDIDVIAYERLRTSFRGLTLPHPHAHEREFVLRPLRGISPETAKWVGQR